MIEFRPIPVRHIESNFWRRTLMIITFVPILLIVWIVELLRAIKFLTIAIVMNPVWLFKSGVKYWHEPQHVEWYDE